MIKLKLRPEKQTKRIHSRFIQFTIVEDRYYYLVNVRNDEFYFSANNLGTV